MKIRLKISASIWRQLRAHHLAPGKRVEAMSFLWARAVVTSDAITILVPHTAQLMILAEDCFERQSAGNVRLRVDVLNGMLIRFAAAGDYNVLINIHDHWFDDLLTAFSGVDDRDDLDFDRYLRHRFEPMLETHPDIGPARRIFNFSIVLAQQGCDARLTDIRRNPRFRTLDSIDILGEDFQRITPRQAPLATSAEEHSRQRDFIGPRQQALLGDLTGVLFGAGGLGSISGENLGRLGLGALYVVDDDRIDHTNLNRWQGADPSDIDRPKAEVLAERLSRMFPAMKVEALTCSAFDRRLEKYLAKADFLIGGLDNDPARYFLAAASAQYLLPYFDAGVAVEVGDKTDFLSRYFHIMPGVTGCLRCTAFHLVDWQQVENAFLDPATRQAKQAAGYVVDQPQISAPSVYSLNQQAVATLTTEFLNTLCGWRPLATSVRMSWRDGNVQRADRSNFPETPAVGCPLCGFLAGVGDSEELPRPPEFSGTPVVPDFSTHPL